MQIAQTNQNEMEREPCIGHERGRSSVAGIVMKTCCFIAGLVAVMIGMPFSSMAAMGSVTFEAESGTLGANFMTGNSSGVIYISNTSDNTGVFSSSPGISGRVASYSVTFPSAGTYDLYARVRVGPGGANDDSFFYGSDFGVKSLTTAGDWTVVDGVADRGFANPTDVVTVGGSVGTNVWKWINVSQDTGATGETPITFTVTAGNLNQTLQIGGKENGFDMDKFVFGKVGYPFTVADLDAGTTPELPPTAGHVSVPNCLNNGDLSINYGGTPGRDYAAEWTDSLIPPVTWTPMVTNTANSSGLVKFTNTPADLQAFYRIHDVTPITPIDTNTIPLVYAVENTGTNYPAPPLPTIANLPLVPALPDPFAWANDPLNVLGTRSTNFSDWSHHRAEFKAQIENYEIGYRPLVDPSMIFASISGSGTSRTLTVRVTNIVNGAARTLTLTSAITLPASSGTFPVIIGIFREFRGWVGRKGKELLE
jgi:hypothetical protein